MKKTLVFLMLILASGVLSAANIYVNHAGNDAIVSASGYVLANTAKTVTKTAAFTNYRYNTGDQFQVVSGTGATPGYYTIASKTSANVIVLATGPGDCANATCIGGNDGTTETTSVGTLHGPYRTIQFALDKAASGDTIWVKNDVPYVMNGTDQPAATIDVDTNPCSIRGYYLTIGDQDVGGAYYKNATHGLVVLDALNGNFNVLSVGELSSVSFQNLKFINVNTSRNSLTLATSETQGSLCRRSGCRKPSGYGVDVSSRRPEYGVY